MADKNRWSWDVKGFEPKKTASFDVSDHQSKPASLGRRYSISSSILPPSELSKYSVVSKVRKLEDKLKFAKEDYAVLRQEASDLQEYSIAKLDRITRYVGALADKTRKLDQAALEAEARITPLISEKKRLFNDLLTAKGNIKLFCRTRPLFENEGLSIVEYPDEYTVRVNTDDETLSNPKKDFELDRVYGPHVGQSEVFIDVQPYVQSALDGYNVSVFAYGQTHSGKTYTMEGSSHDRGLYVRCFEELFDLSNSESTTTSRFSFSFTVFELYNEQVKDLLAASGKSSLKLRMGSPGSFIELVSEKVDNPLEFSRVLKAALQSRGPDAQKFNVSHLIVTIHIFYNNAITGENLYSKLSLVDLAGSECLSTDNESGERVTEQLHAMHSLSALGDVLSSLTSKKDDVPYENSLLTKVLADSIGGSSKTLMIVNICPDVSNLPETLSSLNFSSRARSAVLSLGNRDTIKKWKDIANDARKELYEKEKETIDMKQEIMSLQQTVKEADDQCLLLFNEVQKAWKVSFTLQSDLKAENIMLADKHKIEKDQNAQLRNQVAQLLQAEQEQKLQIKERDTTIQNLQAKIGSLEQQLNEALRSAESRSGSVPESNLKAAEDNVDSSAVTKKLEEELLKRDALIERLHEENEKLFDKLTGKAASVGSSQVSSPLSRRESNVQNQDLARNNTSNSTGNSTQVVSGSTAGGKGEMAVALVKPGNELAKTTPAGEYLTAALNDFDPEQYEGLAAISDGANKLLMLVLAAVIKAGASREHEILAEIRDAVFSFIRKMEPKRVMDTMLVSRVRILYIRSLISRSPELQSIKVAPVDRFLERASNGRSRSSSRASSPGRSPAYDLSPRNSLAEGQIQGFRVNIKQEKKSKFSSVVLKLRGIDEETWRQHVTGGKLREITEEAKSFAVGNKALAALFVHTPAGELQRQIRSWLAENFDFLSVTSDDAIAGNTGQLELLSTAIMDGWMAGLGAAQPPSTDALGQLLSEYTKRVYTSQLQHLKKNSENLSCKIMSTKSSILAIPTTHFMHIILIFVSLCCTYHVVVVVATHDIQATPRPNREALGIAIGGEPISIGGSPAPEMSGSCPPPLPPPAPCPPPPSLPPPTTPPPPSPSPPPPSNPPPSSPPPPLGESRVLKATRVIQQFIKGIDTDKCGLSTKVKHMKNPNLCVNPKFGCAPLPNTKENGLYSFQFNECKIMGKNITLDNFINKLADVSIFHANTNNYGGKIPVLSGLPYLFELDLSNNKYTGKFPMNVLTATKLTFLDLRFNSFVGPVPPELFDLQVLALFINNNQFEHDLPLNMGSTPAAFLTFANNKFTGPIPRSIGQASNTLLEVLFLGNRFSGCLPYEIGLLKKARVFDVSKNVLTGPIPRSFACLGKMEYLVLEKNEFYGPVPEEVCMLPHLTQLKLCDNYFTQVGPECMKLIRKGVLDVRHNCILGLPDQRSPDDCAFFFKRPKTCGDLDNKMHKYMPCKKTTPYLNAEMLIEGVPQPQPSVTYGALSP